MSAICDYVLIKKGPPHTFRCRQCDAVVTSMASRVINDCPKAPKGLGDVIERATRRVGIKPCGGCGKRKKWTNQRLKIRGRG